jgi:three-Cys-motif partner protein
LIKRDKFYQSPTDASRVKQAIVATYFGAWKNVLKTWRNSPTLAYVDLYSGHGIYADGSPSTPLLVLQQAIEDDYLARNFVAIFNDDDPHLAAELRTHIAALPGIHKLRNPPAVHEYDVSDKVIRLAPKTPTLLFADPWGYKGLSLGLIEAFLSRSGSDCIFFFNYNRISAGLGWKGFDVPLDLVFGQVRANSLRVRVKGMSPPHREQTIVEEMKEALKEIGAHCALPFRFVSGVAHRTSHHLLFASKHPLGCKIMKNIMRDHSSNVIQGLGSFEFTGSSPESEQMLLPGYGPFDAFRVDLNGKYTGQTLSFDELFSREDHPTAVERNYKDAILQLEQEGELSIVIPGRKRRHCRGQLTLPSDAIITFRRAGDQNG